MAEAELPEIIAIFDLGSSADQMNILAVRFLWQGRYGRIFIPISQNLLEDDEFNLDAFLRQHIRDLIQSGEDEYLAILRQDNDNPE